MKDIKEKVRDKNPKIRNPASRLPKELVRSAMLETKEKSRMAADKVGRETGEESPVEYAGTGWNGQNSGLERKCFGCLSWWKEVGSENL
mgnify:CR=1 FL=1